MRGYRRSASSASFSTAPNKAARCFLPNHLGTGLPHVPLSRPGLGFAGFSQILPVPESERKQDFSQWRNDRPLGISCAATLLDGQDPELWYSRLEDGSFAKIMSREDLIKLVKFLMAAVEEGMQILTWNGLGFDFDVLVEESGCWQECQSLARDHTDLMFHIFCEKGYPIGLDKAAKGMRLAGKTEGMSGELAPILWQQGQYEKVLEYVAQDVRTTLGVAKAGLQKRRITWYSNRGRLQELGLPRGWLAVDQALRMPLPDNSWMTNPLSRQDFLRWTIGPDANIR